MRIRALILRIIRQFLHDKRSMALLIAAPILVLSLMYLVFDSDAYEPKLGTVQLPSAITDSLSRLNAEVTAYDTTQAADAALADQSIDAYVWLDGTAPRVKLEGSDPAKNRAAMMTIQQATQQHAAAAAAASTGAAGPTFEYLHGSGEMSTFDSLSPVLIGLFAFFFVFLIAGVSFLKERTSGTLERLLATPLRRWEIVAGYMAGFGIFTSVQAILIAGYTIGALGSFMAGSFGYVILIMLLLSVTALSFGTFLSAFANSEFQMIQFIPLVIVPQVFFSGMFDLDSISPWLSWIAHITPLKYGADALRSVMIRGEGWNAIAQDVYVLLGLSLLFMAANVLALRKHRRI
jgi:ABC-2 type transport system permease protein